MRVTLDEVSSTFHDKCGVNAGDKVNVFWLTDTLFDETFLSGSSLEDALQGQKLGVAGSIFLASDQQANQNLGLPSPSTSPATTAGALNTNCTLVADRVTAGTATLPTVRPRTTTTVVPRATARRTATPRPTATLHPTATPAPPTATPSPAPTPSGTP
jgi:hypothetical protein